MKAFEAVAIGTSAGGLKALLKLLAFLPPNFSPAILVVQHLSPQSKGDFSQVFQPHCALVVKEAEEKEKICGGKVYLAPADYHLLVERDQSLSLSVDEKVNFSRPSIDVLFESAAEAYGLALIGVILSGANADGAYGAKVIKNFGGKVLVQNPTDAEVPIMPRAAIVQVPDCEVLTLEEIGDSLIRIAGG